MTYKTLKSISLFLTLCNSFFLAESQPAIISPNTQTQPSATESPLYPNSYGQNLTLNQIRVWQGVRPINDESNIIDGSKGINQVRQAAQFFDGLGRLLQSVQKKGSPNERDVVSAADYDQYGRQLKQFLPYTSTELNGNFKTNPFTPLQTFQTGIFSNEQFFYSQTDYEASPLNRPVKSYSPGKSWAGSLRGISIEYLNNTSNDLVRKWNIGFTFGTLPYTSTEYAEANLYKTVVTDEHGKKTEEYKDMQGRIVLKKVQISTNTPNPGYIGWLSTYYIYDDLGKLRFVIPPKATTWLRNNGWSFGQTATYATSTIAQELCYSYEYDARGRMIYKRIPGAGEIWMVYDKRDRVVLTQDNKQHTTHTWNYIQYDEKNRPVRTGIWTESATHTRDYHQYIASTREDYPNSADMGSGNELLTETYYDDYDWVNATGSGLSNKLITDHTDNTDYFPNASNSADPYPQKIKQTKQTAGMITGSRVKVLGTDIYLYSATFYDENGRIIQVQTDHIKPGTDNNISKGGTDYITTQYSFDGKILRTLLYHAKQNSGATSYLLLTKMEYDNGGRLITVKKQLVGSEETTISKMEYDEANRLVSKELGKTRNQNNAYVNAPVEKLDYSYNIRGWLTGINKAYANKELGAPNAWFGMELSYDFGFNQNQYNGNIAGIKWRSKGDDQQRAYGYDYDAANRILKADFTQNAGGNTWDRSAGIDFSLSSMAYDENGNITAMKQKALKLNSSIDIDDLSYHYFNGENSNRLQYVQDTKNDAASQLGDFKELTTTTNNSTNPDYGYDNNGNMTSDANKDITGINGIVYNHLNLPTVVTINGKGTITYTYDAAGNKLKKTVLDNTGSSAKTTITYYTGAFTYENNDLQFITQEEGRIRLKIIPADPNPITETEYDYFIKDHLGNVRMVLTDEIKKDVYPDLSFEGGVSSGEVENQNAVWDNRNGGSIDVAASRTSRPGNFGTSTSNGNKVMLIQKSTGAIGATKMLKVMSGDKLNVSVDYYYTATNADNSGAGGYNTFVNSLMGILVGSDATSNLVKNNAASVVTAQQGDNNVTNFFLPENSGSVGSSNPPKAYLHILLFDERFVFDNINSYVQQVDYTPNTYATIIKAGLNVKKNGYVYIYFSNESNELVYFDNFKLTHERSSLIEETHYAPFGLALKGISSRALNLFIINKYKFNGSSEFQSEEFADGGGLELYDAVHRMYDPQIGRFHQIDPWAEISFNWSPFTFVQDNPISFSDPLGLTDSVNGFNAPISTPANLLPDAGTPVTVKSKVKPFNAIASIYSVGVPTMYGFVAWRSITIPAIRAGLETASEALLADDVTGIGVADDELIIVLEAIDGALWLWQVANSEAHKNSKLSDLPQEGYAIYDKDGNVMEYGITSRGADTRIKEKLRKKYGNASGYYGKRIAKNIKGREKALEWEKEKVADYQKNHKGENPPNQGAPKPKPKTN